MFTGSIVPVLRIFDLDKALDFYVGFLGFTEVFRHQFEPGTPYYMGLTREGVSLHLSEHFGDATPGTHVRIEAVDVEGLCATLNAKGYRHSRPAFQDQEWGNREMTIPDPFGNRVTFWQPLAGRGLESMPFGWEQGMSRGADRERQPIPRCGCLLPVPCSA